MKTILIVDDNESICNILYHYGKEAGYTMVIAHTGQEGLTYFTNYKPDVILLDAVSYTHLDVYKRQILACPFPHSLIRSLPSCEDYCLFCSDRNRSEIDR